ncbi:nucleotide exchange factor GrpE [Psittacicella melopsittaci]|uniref:Protein GrpE n=1 Tax=Psittacicella melopsittaci TaxID=2028576 RepID=A0A3A1Y7N8_9GAMM|nr:nucleotide exchange factor GrpE [Psittacicella melopsittaci]RIY33270.1 nucleotide exchange factor GrpE [Psittacicella melopsittaci]
MSQKHHYDDAKAQAAKAEEKATQAEVEAEKAEAQADLAHEKAEQAQAQAEQAQEQAEQAQEQAQEAEAQAEQADAQAAQAEQEAAQAEAQADLAHEEVKALVLAEEIDHLGTVSSQALSFLEELLKRLAQEQVSPEELQEVADSLATLSAKEYELAQNNLTVENDLQIQRIASRTPLVEEESRRLERALRDTENAVNFANEKVIKNAIKPLFQNLDMAANRLPKDTGNAEFDAFIAYLKEFDKEFKKDLEKHGVKIYGAVGDKFDPNLHDAVAQYPYQTPEQAGTVAHVVSQGYELNGRIVSPASVVAFQAEE